MSLILPRTGSRISHRFLTKNVAMMSTSSEDDVKVTQSKRRRRRSRSFGDDVPSYKEFVHRSTVISLYRNCLKAVRLMPHNQEDLRLQVQNEFRANKDDSDPFNTQRSLAEGKRKYQELQEMTGHKKQEGGDSWLNTDDPEDTRGRVGTGWPWMQ
jgi:hypothetical protein